MYFKVAFQYSERVWCTNIAHAETVEAVKAHYEKAYKNVSIRVAQASEVREAKRKGMPILDI